MKAKMFVQLLILIFISSIASVAHSQADAPSIKIGESDFFPSAQIQYITNSNAFLTQENETEATGVLISPKLELTANRRLLELVLAYEGDYASYSEGVLDYDDHKLSFGANAELGNRQRVQASVAISKEHETLGTLLTRAIADENTEQIEFSNFEAQASFAYGALNAKGNVEAGLRVTNLNFLNQDALTDGRSYSEVVPFGLFSYRLSADSRLLLEASVSDLSFDDRIRDRTDLTALAGISLGENRKTSGVAKVGFTQASFAQQGRGDQESVVADMLLTWKPTSSSRVGLTIRREFDNADSEIAGDLTVADTLTLDWVHAWTTRVKTDAFVSLFARERDCPNLDTATTSAGFRIAFFVRRWLSLGAGVSTASRTSGDCPVPVTGQENLDFDRQIANVFLRATL